MGTVLETDGRMILHGVPDHKSCPRIVICRKIGNPTVIQYLLPNGFSSRPNGHTDESGRILFEDSWKPSTSPVTIFTTST